MRDTSQYAPFLTFFNSAYLQLKPDAIVLQHLHHSWANFAIHLLPESWVTQAGRQVPLELPFSLQRSVLGGLFILGRLACLSEQPFPGNQVPDSKCLKRIPKPVMWMRWPAGTVLLRLSCHRTQAASVQNWHPPFYHVRADFLQFSIVFFTRANKFVFITVIYKNT